MSFTEITPKVALEVLHHEGLVRQAYYDSVGVLTWSAGITDASGHKVGRYIRNPQPMRRCLEVYLWLLEKKYAPAVRKAFEGVNLSEAQFAAALSFHWNTGAILKASWVKSYKAGQIAKAERQFMNWRKPASIIGRREDECDLFFDSVWVNDGRTTEYTRVTKSLRPDWGSSKRVDIRADIVDILEKQGREEQPAQDDAMDTPAGGGLLAKLLAILLRSKNA